VEWAISDAAITTTRRRAWSISAKRGELDVWSTSDGSIFVEGVTSLNVVYALFPQFHEVCPDLALEDRITRLPGSESHTHGWPQIPQRA
jgi:hypothetical protein